MKKIKFYVLAALAFGMTPYLLAYMLIVNGDSFKVAKEYIQSSNLAANRFGNIKELTLKPFGFSFHLRGTEGAADFEIKVSGDKGNGVAFLILEKRLGEWTVKDSRFSGVE